MSELKGAMIIGQSGGPSSVINASCYGAIKAGLDSDAITKVYGAANGIVGVLNDKLYIMDEEDPEELAIMKYTPSSALGSCRYKIADPDVDDTDYKRILEIFKKYDVRYFGAAQPENTDIGDTFVANADAAGDAYWDNAVRSFNGSTLMGFGIGAPLKGDFDSRCVVIRPKNE
jgi:hypothetical protein